jgi:hypothetical protein
MTFTDRVERYKGRLIRRALNKSGGRVSEAARLLNMRHQSLVALLNKRHKDLRVLPKQTRRKPLMTIPRESKPRHFGQWDRPAL